MITKVAWRRLWSALRPGALRRGPYCICTDMSTIFSRRTWRDGSSRADGASMRSICASTAARWRPARLRIIAAICMSIIPRSPVRSTGGLLASLYASDGRRRADIERLILNSPFFEFNASWFKRRVAVPVAAVLGRLWPYAHKKNELSPFYFDSVYRGARGEWDFDTQWKPRDGVPLYFIWLGAIRKAQRRLRRGLGLRIPVLVLSSADSCRAKTWNDCFRSADAVLNVADIRRYAGCLGSCVTSVTIEGGLHDLVLSAAPVREKVLETMTSWLDCPESRSDPSAGESSA